jgi:hypothetical protein
MIRIAHVSDAHVLDLRPGAAHGIDVRFLSFGRRLDAQSRANKLAAAVRRGAAWLRALGGPLRRFAPTAAMEPGRVLDLGSAFLFPMDVSFPQPIARAAGMLTESAARALDRRLDDASIAKKPQVVVQHHPPFPRITRAWDWVDGLRGGDRMLAMMTRRPSMYVLHGHLHEAKDHAPRIFGAPAVVEDDDDRPRVRLYEACDRGLVPAGLA